MATIGKFSNKNANMNSLNNITISKLQALATLSMEKVGAIANTTDFNCNFEVHDSLRELRMVHSNIKYLDWNEKYILRQGSDDGFTAKQLILGENIILRAHNENYTDIVVKGSLELFGVVTSSIRRFKR